MRISATVPYFLFSQIRSMNPDSKASNQKLLSAYAKPAHSHTFLHHSGTQHMQADLSNRRARMA